MKIPASFLTRIPFPWKRTFPLYSTIAKEHRTNVRKSDILRIYFPSSIRFKLTRDSRSSKSRLIRIERLRSLFLFFLPVILSPRGKPPLLRLRVPRFSPSLPRRFKHGRSKEGIAMSLGVPSVYRRFVHADYRFQATRGRLLLPPLRPTCKPAW